MSRYDNNAGKNVYITPKWIIEALGPFDLDPACNDIMPYETAMYYCTKENDGLKTKWPKWCRVWLNPPYLKEKGKTVVEWCKKIAEHGNGIMLLSNNTENKYWHDEIFPHAHGMLLVKGRIDFWDEQGKEIKGNFHGSILVAYGKRNARILRKSGIPGKYIKLK